MAHKKVHPAESRAPQTDHEHSVNPPIQGAQNLPPAAADYEHDTKHNQGAFERKGDHARQQQMGNKD